MSRDKVKTLYLHFNKTYQYQIWHSGNSEQGVLCFMILVQGWCAHGKGFPSLKWDIPLVEWSRGFTWQIKNVMPLPPQDLFVTRIAEILFNSCILFLYPMHKLSEGKNILQFYLEIIKVSNKCFFNVNQQCTLIADSHSFSKSFELLF